MSTYNCPVCNQSSSISRLFSKMLNVVNTTDMRVRVCNACGFRFLRPYLDPSELPSMYASGYFTGKPVVARGAATPAGAINYEACTVPVRRPVFQRTLRTVLAHRTDARSLLDVGCGTGEFLHLAKTHGLDAHGIEISAYAAERARAKYAVDVFAGALEQYPGSRQFDVVHLSHVLEHFIDPLSAIRKVKNLTTTNGVVSIEVPYQFNLVECAKYIARKNTPEFDVRCLHHASFFTPRSLVGLCRMVGLTPLNLTLFDAERYPHCNIVDQVKRATWKMLSSVNQGFNIQALFVAR